MLNNSLILMISARLAAENPDKVKIEVIGRTHEGREIRVARVGHRLVTTSDCRNDCCPHIQVKLVSLYSSIVNIVEGFSLGVVWGFDQAGIFPANPRTLFVGNSQSHRKS